MLQVPLSIITSLKNLGENIRNARKRRRITMALLAERAKISRVTLAKIEKGDRLFTVHANSESMFEKAKTSVLSSIELGEEKPTQQPIVAERVT